MAVNDALSQVQGFNTKDPYSTGIGKLQYRAANIETEQVGPSELHQIFDSFMSMVKPVTKAYDSYLQSDSKKRMDEAEKEFRTTGNPAVFHEALNKGTLFHHDNPYTYRYVQESFGQRAQLQADDELNSLISQGLLEANTPAFESKKYELRQKAIANIGKEFQIDTSSEEFNRGFTSQIIESDNVLNRNFERFKSEKIRKDYDFNMKNKVTGIIQDTTAIPEVRVMAAQAELIRGVNNGVLSGDNLRNTVDYLQQKFSESKDGAVSGPLFASSYIQTSLDENGDPVYNRVSDIIGGEAVVRDRQLRAQDTQIKNSVSFLEIRSQKSSELFSMDDVPTAIALAKNFRANEKRESGIDPEQGGTNSDAYWNGVIQQLESNLDKRNQSVAQQQEKEKLAIGLRDEIYQNYTRAMQNGEAFDWTNSYATSAYGASQDDWNVAAKQVMEQITRESIFNPNLTPEARMRNMMNYYKASRHDPKSMPATQMKNIFRDSYITNTDTRYFDLMRESFDVNEDGMRELLLNSDISGDYGRQLFDDLNVLKHGGMTADEVRSLRQRKTEQPEYFDKVVNPKVDTILYGDNNARSAQSQEGLMQNMGVPDYFGSSVKGIYSSVYATKGEDAAKVAVERFLEANTVDVGEYKFPGGNIFNPSLKVPIATLRVDGPQNDGLVRESISDIVVESGIKNMNVSIAPDGSLVLHDPDARRDPVAITHADLVERVENKRKAQVLTTEQQVKDLESRTNTNNPLDVFNFKNKGVKTSGPLNAPQAYPYQQ